MPIPYDNNGHDHIEQVVKAEVSNDFGCSWLKLLVLKLPVGGAGIGVAGSAMFGYIVPQMAAEGAGFATPEQAIATGTRIILGAVLVMLAVVI